MSFEYCFSETNIVWLLYFLCLAQSEEDLQRFQVEAQELYTCKQIFGLCHSSPRLEIQSGLQKIENLLEEKTILYGVCSSIQNLTCRKIGCCCMTYIMVCDRKKHKLSMERETWGFDCVIRPLCCVWSVLLSHHRDDLLPRETLIVLLSKICDRPSIMSRQSECYCGVFIPLFTVSGLAPIIRP